MWIMGGMVRTWRSTSSAVSPNLGMLLFFSCFRSLQISLRVRAPPCTLYTVRYPNTSARWLAALIWDECVEHGCCARSFIGRIILLPALWTFICGHSIESDSSICSFLSVLLSFGYLFCSHFFSFLTCCSSSVFQLTSPSLNTGIHRYCYRLTRYSMTSSISATEIMQTKHIEPHVLDLRVCFLSIGSDERPRMAFFSLGFTSIGTYASRRRSRNHPMWQWERA